MPQPKPRPPSFADKMRRIIDPMGGFLQSEQALNSRVQKTNAKKLEGNPGRLEGKK